jgi:hypothetical protein
VRVCDWVLFGSKRPDARGGLATLPLTEYSGVSFPSSGSRADSSFDNILVPSSPDSNLHPPYMTNNEPKNKKNMLFSLPTLALRSTHQQFSTNAHHACRQLQYCQPGQAVYHRWGRVRTESASHAPASRHLLHQCPPTPGIPASPLSRRPLPSQSKSDLDLRRR